MIESADLLIEGFPYSTIEKHAGELNYQVIKEVEQKLLKMHPLILVNLVEETMHV